MTIPKGLLTEDLVAEATLVYEDDSLEQNGEVNETSKSKSNKEFSCIID